MIDKYGKYVIFYEGDPSLIDRSMELEEWYRWIMWCENGDDEEE